MLIEESDLPMVAMDFMNEVHKEEAELINALFERVLAYEADASEANANAITEKYQEWYTHTLAHFKGEEDKMVELKFPPYPLHKQEHDIAVQRMDEVFADWQQSKNAQSLKMYLIEELPRWLIQHISTLDVVTARFFSTGFPSAADLRHS
ncbi:MAG: hypothetical protein GQ531_02895 [Sulfurovum sp.]|nr:hypothetical protein [Sulfurovum sp.]